MLKQAFKTGKKDKKKESKTGTKQKARKQIGRKTPQSNNKS